MFGIQNLLFLEIFCNRLCNVKTKYNLLKDSVIFFLNMKRSGVDQRPTPEGSLTEVSYLLWVVVNRGLDILNNLCKLNITRY